MSSAAPREARRRALHLAFAAVGVAWYLHAPPRTLTFLLVTLVVLALALELLRHFSAGVAGLLERLSAGAMRPEETRGVTGATLLVTGALVAWLAFPAAAAAPAMVVVAAADPAAALVGTRARGSFGRKTWVGTAAAFVVGLLVLLLLRVPGLTAACAAALAALVERLAPRRLDNLLMPPVTAAAIAVLS